MAGVLQRSIRRDWNALYLASGYVVVSLIWIWGSDWLVNLLSNGDPSRQRWIQSAKGTTFVLATGAGLWAAIALANARERKLQQEKRLVEDMLAVSQRLEALGTLAGTLAHDFNNVLAVIRAETELLRLQDFDPAEVPTRIASIELATKRADHMVQELVSYMRNAPTAFVYEDPTPTIEQAGRFARSALPPEIELRVNLDQPLPPIQHDRSQLERALHNLLLNARDAVRDQPVKRIELSASRRSLRNHRSLFRPTPVSGDFVTISVSDTGCGIAPENHARIFAPFYTTKGSGRGTGLGLSSVLRVMQAHQGWVELTSQPGKGACFTLYFPANDVPT